MQYKSRRLQNVFHMILQKNDLTWLNKTPYQLFCCVQVYHTVFPIIQYVNRYTIKNIFKKNHIKFCLRNQTMVISTERDPGMTKNRRYAVPD